MAKIVRTETFNNAEISLEDMTLTEVSKDDVEVFDIMDILKKWDGLPGLKITFAYGEPVKPCE